jgi:hypothetical protein
LTYQSNKGTNNQSITQYLKRGIGIKKGGKDMKRFNLSQIMKSAHRKFRSAKGEKSFSECLKSAWMFAKVQDGFSTENIAKRDREFVQAQNVKFDNVVPTKRSSYDDLSIPVSAYYNAYSTGRFGSHFVND